MKLLLITIVLLGLAVAGIAIKIWGKKEGKFAGTCASQSPFLTKVVTLVISVVKCQMSKPIVTVVRKESNPLNT